MELKVMADRLVLVLCPFCGSKEHRHAEDIVQLVLDEANLRRRDRPPSAIDQRDVLGFQLAVAWIGAGSNWMRSLQT